jgi:hypothetical protein
MSAAELIAPEIRELMARIESLAEACACEQPGAGFTETRQLYSVATYWGAPRLVAALRAIEARLAPAAGVADEGQLALDLAA